MQEPPPCRPARPDEWTRAFELIFQHVPKEARQGLVRNALRLMHQGELNEAGVLVVPGGRTLLGAMVCLSVAGASALIWPPQTADDGVRQEIEDRLLTYAITWLRQAGAKLGQTLLAQDEVHLAASLERHGFVHITSLLYMRHDLHLPVTRPPSLLTYQTYSACDQTEFHQTLLRSYEQTLDCPEVNGVRTLHEVVEGHQAQGIYDPTRWWLALQADRPVGVLLTAEVSEWQGWDLSYVGVVPDARHRGIGRELTRKALAAARAAGASQVTLAVDTRNSPACKLYQSLGFESFDRREVYLAIWNNKPAQDTGW